MFQVGCFQPVRKLDRSQRTAAAQRTGDAEQHGPRAWPSSGGGWEHAAGPGAGWGHSPARERCLPRHRHCRLLLSTCLPGLSPPPNIWVAPRYVPRLSPHPDASLLSPACDMGLAGGSVPAWACGEGRGRLAAEPGSSSQPITQGQAAKGCLLATRAAQGHKRLRPNPALAYLPPLRVMILGSKLV